LTGTNSSKISDSLSFRAGSLILVNKKTARIFNTKQASAFIHMPPVYNCGPITSPMARPSERAAMKRAIMVARALGITSVIRGSVLMMAISKVM
jgi:hypothetical protein